MITYRVLEQSEHGIASLPDGVVFPPFAVVLGAFNDEGELVGRTSIIPVPHIEGTWVREDQRGGLVGARLVQNIEQVAAGVFEATTVFAFVLDAQPEVADYMTRLGYEKQPMTVWLKKLEPKEK